MMWKLIVVGIGLVAGDLLMKNWSINGASFRDLSVLFYILGVVAYGASFTLYAYQLRTMNFGIATIAPILINIVVVALISFSITRRRSPFHKALEFSSLSALSFYFLGRG